MCCYYNILPTFELHGMADLFFLIFQKQFSQFFEESYNFPHIAFKELNRRVYHF